MANLQLKQVPISKTGMLIRRPVADVFEAFVNPDITTKFWFTKSQGDRRTLTCGFLDSLRSSCDYSNHKKTAPAGKPQAGTVCQAG